MYQKTEICTNAGPRTDATRELSISGRNSVSCTSLPTSFYWDCSQLVGAIPTAGIAPTFDRQSSFCRIPPGALERQAPGVRGNELVDRLRPPAALVVEAYGRRVIEESLGNLPEPLNTLGRSE